MAELGMVVVETNNIRNPASRAWEIVERLLENEGEQGLDHLEELLPDLFESAMMRRQHRERQRALEEFEEELSLDEWHEAEWERFFRRNKWIFGFGLAYQFIRTVQNQPHYGGDRLDGRGGQRGDFLMATEAAARFTVLVEIKKPGTRLLEIKPYRGDSVFHVSKDVAGGVAQIRANCSTWSHEGSRSSKNIRNLILGGMHTEEPKGILVVGNTREFSWDDERARCFERFRRNLHNPEIVTFDELLERARYLVASEFDTAGSAPSAEEDEGVPF